MPPGYQYGPGDAMYSPGIFAKIDSNMLRFDYYFSHWGLISSSYDLIDSVVHINRSFTEPSKNFISIDLWNINVDQENYPLTIWPNNIISQSPSLHFTYVDGNYSSYTPLENDSTQFSLTLNSFVDNRLTGTFAGKLYKQSDTTISVNISIGQFDVLLRKY